MSSTLSKTLLTAVAIGLAASAPNAQAAGGDGGWDWMVAPYAWLAGIKTDLRKTTPPSADLASDTSFDDVIDKLDGAFQGHVEGQGDDFGMFADFTYLALADEKDRTRFRTEADLDTRLFEVAAVWNPGEGRFKGFDVFAGLRHVDVDFNLDVIPVDTLLDGGTLHAARKFDDLMIGARYTWDLSPHWGMTLRGDTSFGDTEGTWNASATAQYRTKNGAWLLGYRYLTVDLKPTGKEIKIAMSGPMIGYAFRF